jgi:hypothetical protein
VRPKEKNVRTGGIATVARGPEEEAHRLEAQMKSKRAVGSLPRFTLAFGAVTLLFVLTAAPSGQALGTDVPDWVGKLTLANTNLITLSNPESTQEELPGLGHKFELLFAMTDGQDPQNLTNDVITVTTTTAYPAGIGVAFRNTPPGFKIAALDHQINLKYFFPARSCSGGSPRVQVAIDSDGDGDFDQFDADPDDGNAFGYVGHAPFGTGCITAEWDIIDMTDNIGRWDLSQLGGGMTMTWDQAEAFITTTYPNHRVISGSLVDDSCSFAVASCGQAYYDLFTYENRTLEQDQDTV